MSEDVRRTREQAAAEVRELAQAAMGLIEARGEGAIAAALARLGDALPPFAWAFEDDAPRPVH